jgi:hypothetical protein
MKTKSIKIVNFKAITDLTATFDGCSAIITGGNNKGKSSLLTGIQERIRGTRPDAIVTKGQKEGEVTIELTTGEKFFWSFDEKGKDKLTFTTKEGIKTSVTKEIAKRFYPPVFDIDEFLNSQPKEQNKMIQKLVGLDFTAIDFEYKQAYDDRTIANKELTTAKAKLPEIVPGKVELSDVSELLKEKEIVKATLDKLYQDNKKKNDTMRLTFASEKEVLRKECEEFNIIQSKKSEIIDDYIVGMKNIISEAKEYKLLNFIKKEEFDNFIKTLDQPLEKIEISVKLLELKEPEYIEPEMPDDAGLKEIDTKIANISLNNEAATAYKSYLENQKAFEIAQQNYTAANILVKSIENRKADMLKQTNFPEGIELTENGIFVDGFLLNKASISTSKLYCTALRLASLGLGEVKTLHFDASTLDNETLNEIMVWAESQDLQLLIEIIDREAGDIAYEIVDNSNEVITKKPKDVKKKVVVEDVKEPVKPRSLEDIGKEMEAKREQVIKETPIVKNTKTDEEEW